MHNTSSSVPPRFIITIIILVYVYAIFLVVVVVVASFVANERDGR